MVGSTPTILAVLVRAAMLAMTNGKNTECMPPGMPPMPADDPLRRLSETTADTPAAPQAYQFIMLLILNMLSGTFSGLNLGLMSLTVEDLSIIIQGSANPKEIKWAQKILPLRKTGNLLLCTLLVGNTLVNVMLAIFTEPIWSWMFGDPDTSVIAFIMGLAVPTALIVIFGEIIPQAYCGRNSLFVGALSVPLVWFFLVVCFPLCKPIAVILDFVLGREVSNVLSRHMLLELVTLNVDSDEHAKQSGLTKEDGKLLKGALTFKDRTVGDVMTPFANCFCLPDSTLLNSDVLIDILGHGHTRIPVYTGGDKANIVAVLFIKDLVGIGFERSQPLKEVLESFDAIRRVVRVPRSTKLNVAMDHCKRTRQHLLLVCDDDDSTAAAIAEAESKPAVKASPRGLEMPPPVRANAPVMGVASMEDFIEELIQDEIVDETDAWHYDRQEGEKPSAALIETSTKKGAGEQSMKKQPSQVKKVAVKAEGGVDLTAHLRKLAPAPAAASSQGAEWTLAAPPAQMEA